MASTDRTRLPVLFGALAGASGYVLSYLLVYVVAASSVRDSFIGQVLDAGGEGTWKAVGWVFYNAHFVDTVGSFSAFGLDVTRSVNLVGEEFSAVLFLVPPLVLVAAGIAVARAAGRLASGQDAALAGATVVAGYLPLAVAGALLFVAGGEAGDVGPSLVPAVGLAGAVYPLVFGAVGGLVARGTA